MTRLFVLIVLLIAVNPLTAQVRPPADSVVSPDTTRGLAPGTAFYRSLLVPGWGQASVGAYLRGGTFFALQTTSAYMMLKTMARLGEARQVEDRHIASARDSLFRLMEEDTAQKRVLSDPRVFQMAVDSTPSVRRIRGLVNSRKSQRQDWITYTIVWTLASGVDAFVAAHLADFGATINAIPRSTGGTQVQINVPLGRQRE